MSSSSVDASPTPPTHPTTKPLLLAAYRYDDPSRKRRVKVPSDISWKDFLSLFYSRLEISHNVEIEIFDERGIEIVSVEDLVDNDVLVIREKRPKLSLTSSNRQLVRDTLSDPLRRMHNQAPPSHVTSISKGFNARSHMGVGDHTSSMIVGVPLLSHFIRCNSFGYYFLAEGVTMKSVQTQGVGRIKKAHCIVKIPHIKDTIRILESESALLSRISGHKSIISPPNVQIINFSYENQRRFFYSISQEKQECLHQLFTMGGAMEAYIYPLYGITMATKLKSSIPPERVLKYSYQLVDIMNYLQQKGVIHQNLLPENIQVMSNDRLIACNFETAIQTDPNTFLMVVSRGVAAPSNRSGLSPEVISAFSRLKVESETVDYSAQYPWMFGVLSILMATGTHPLNDYPAKYEVGHKIRYRTHHIQALPDPEKYPPVFMKLVKRAMSCDPVRRPTLLQILTILKRDPKILSLMTGNHLPGDCSRRGNTADTVSLGRQPQVTQDTGVKQATPNLSSGRGFYETHPPLSFGQTNYAYSSDYSLPNSSYNSQQNRDDVLTHELSEDPFNSQSKSEQQQSVSCSLDPWYTFTNNSSTTTSTTTNEPSVVAMSTVTGGNKQTLKRYNSSGAFSDDFVMTRLSREPSNQSLPPSAQHLIYPRLAASTEFLHHRNTHIQKKRLGRSVELLGSPLSNGSEGDLKHLQEFQYRRLIHSPNVASSQDLSPLYRRSGDMEHLIRHSSPEPEENTEEITNKENQYTQNVQRTNFSKNNGWKSFGLTKKEVMQQMATSAGRKVPKMVTNVSMGDGSSATSVDRLENLGLDILQHISTLGENRWGGSTTSPVSMEIDDGSANHSHDHHMTGESSSTTGLEACLMSSSNTTAYTQTTPSLDLTGPNSQNGDLNYERNERLESMETSTGRHDLSPEYQTSGSNHMLSDQNYWNGTVNVFPVALDSDPSSLSIDIGSHSEMTQDHIVNVDDQELTPRDDNFLDDQLRIHTNTMDVSSWVQEVTQATNQLAGSDHITNMNTIQTPSNTFQTIGEIPRNNYYDQMSPIPEASQELTNSMSQRTNPNRFSESHQFRSISPISELSSSFLSNTANQNRQKSVSPFRHAALRTSGGGTANQCNDSDVGEQVSASALTTTANGREGYREREGGRLGIHGSSVECGHVDTGDGTGRGQGNVSPLPPTSIASVNMSADRENTLRSNKTGLASIPGVTHQVEQKGQNDGATLSLPDHTTNTMQLGVCTDIVRTPSPHQQAPLTSSGSQQHTQLPDPLLQGSGQDPVLSSVSDETFIDHSRVLRSCTPLSVSSAPPRLNNPGGITRESTRPLSPLATTTLNASMLPVQVTESRPQEGRVTYYQEMSQEGMVGPHPSKRERGGSQLRHEAGRESRSLEGRRSGAHASLQEIGKGRDTASQEVGEENVSRVHHSHQQQENPRVQHSISRDLEMMNLAISGMDSHVSTVSGSSSNSNSFQIRDVSAEQRGRRHHKIDQRTRIQAQTLQNSDESQQNTQHRQNRPSSRQHPHVTATSSPSSVIPSVSATTFRPITPAILSTFRTSSAPSGGSSNERASPHRLIIDNTSLTSSSVTHQQSHDSRQFSHSAGHAHGVSNQPRLHDSRQFSRSTGFYGYGAQNIPQPPQVTADSYDYLPPYSPPTEGQRFPSPQNQQRQRQQYVQQQQQRQQQLQQQLLQRQQQQQQQRQQGDYPEPPPSYDEIFGGVLNNGQRETRDISSRRRRRHRETQSHRRTQSNQMTQSDGRPSLRQSSNLGRLSSFTNFFKRTRKHTHDHLVANTPDSPVVDDYTAQWVASYSHTPRPHTAMEMSQQQRGSRSLPNNDVTDSGHPMHAHMSVPHSRQDKQNRYRHLMTPPIPYRHPPPFPTSENMQQVDGHLVPTFSGHGMSAGGVRGSLNMSTPRLSLGDSATASSRSQSGSNHENVAPMQRIGCDRPRPSSAYLPSEPYIDFSSCTNSSSSFQHHNSRPASTLTGPSFPPSSHQYSSTHSTLPQHSRLIINAENLSASCTNIASGNSGRRTKRRNSLRRRGSERISTPLTQRSTNQETVINGVSSQTSAGERRAVKRVGAEVFGIQQGGIENLSPNPVHDSNLSVNANSNNTNTNTNALATPLGSSNTSPITSPVTAVENQVLSNTATSVDNHQAVSTISSSVTQVASDTSNHVNITLAGSNVSEQIECESTGSNLNANASNIVTSNSNSVSVSSGNSTSSRSAVRLRAERRRSLVISTRSSSEEDATSDPSHSSSHARGRARRRMSLGSSSYMGSQRSQEFNTQVENQLAVGEGLSERVVHQSGDLEEEVTEERSNVGVVTSSQPAVCNEESCDRETSQNDVVVEIADSAPVYVVKSCGHRCIGEGEDILCCLCNRKRQAGRTSRHSPEEQDCQLCVRRNVSEEDNVVLTEQRTIGLGNMKVTTVPDSTPSTGGQEQLSQRQTRGNKNCVVM